MHTVAKTEAYPATARRAGMTEREMESAVAMVAAIPRLVICLWVRRLS